MNSNTVYLIKYLLVSLFLIIVGIYLIFKNFNKSKKVYLGIACIAFSILVLLVTIVPYSHITKKIKQSDESINKLSKISFQSNVKSMERIIPLLESVVDAQKVFFLDSSKFHNRIDNVIQDISFNEKELDFYMLLFTDEEHAIKKYEEYLKLYSSNQIQETKKINSTRYYLSYRYKNSNNILSSEIAFQRKNVFIRIEDKARTDINPLRDKVIDILVKELSDKP